jgi:hypothetical protein
MSLPSKFFVGRGGAASSPIQINQTYNVSSSGRSGTPYLVTLNGTYNIEVVGAQPPRQTYATGLDGGAPARLIARYTFPIDTDVRILVGQKATQGQFHGGGGGSFVSIAGNTQSNDTPLIVAGGGGSHRVGSCGGVGGSGGGNSSEMNATFPSSFGQSNGASNNTNAGGTNGNAGADNTNNEGGAGSGYNQDAPGGGNEIAALAYVNGGTGGLFNSTGSGAGGYGGGGAGGYGGSGGGGGYNGGGAGLNCTANYGGGGGSYISSGYSGVILLSGISNNLAQSGVEGYVTINTHVPGSSGVNFKVPYDTNFTDTSFSSYAGTASGTGTVQISSSAPKYGTGSLEFVTKPAWVEYSSTIGDFGSGDFTVDFWVKTNTNANSMGIVTQASAGGGSTTSWGFFCGYGNTNNVAFYMSNGSSYFQSITAGTTNICTGNWVHLAACRSGQTVYLFADGNLQGTTNVSTTAFGNGNLPIRVGAQDSYYALPAGSFIDDLRIVKGTALHTTSFTPPTGPTS